MAVTAVGVFMVEPEDFMEEGVEVSTAERWEAFTEVWDRLTVGAITATAADVTMAAAIGADGITAHVADITAGMAAITAGAADTGDTHVTATDGVSALASDGRGGATLMRMVTALGTLPTTLPTLTMTRATVVRAIHVPTMETIILPRTKGTTSPTRQIPGLSLRTTPKTLGVVPRQEGLRIPTTTRVT
jgi:hypothetical protein